MDCSPPGFSVHGILQARILEWVATSFSRGSSWPTDWTLVSCIASGCFTVFCIASGCFTVWATREAHSQSRLLVFPVVMESWTIKTAECQKLDAFKLWCWRRLESPLDSKIFLPVNTKGKQHWIFIGRTDAEAEAPITWQPDVKSRLTGKDPNAGKDLRQEEEGTTEDEMVGWHYQRNGHEFEWAPEVGDEQEAWHAAVHGVTKSRTQLSDWTVLNI